MQKNWQTVVLFLYRFFITFAYDMFYLIQAEFFPSQIRSIGLMATACSIGSGMAADVSEKILFILSGQSNMQAIRPKATCDQRLGHIVDRAFRVAEDDSQAGLMRIK